MFMMMTTTMMMMMMKASSFWFLFWFWFFPGLAYTEVTRRPILTHNSSNYAESHKDVPFGVRTMAGHI